ncbi:MAG TPA: tetratricopeptide repeat protein [Candidatus Methylacidiphilales bacterium]|jgi:tetratricopeptide (TPR) repeat protein|nr:tetratricopeptide repeat protein [Candidatus Methylacidiphilales bacterium]
MAKRSKGKKRLPASKRETAPGAPRPSSPSPAAFSRTVLLPAAVIVAAALLVYGPVLHGEWLWDDDLLVTNNIRLRSVHGLFEIWFSSPKNDYWPLTWTLLWIEWHLWGAAPFAYHVVSLVLHVCSGFLIWRLLGRLGLRWGWLGGLLFVAHPLMVESVAWVAEIKNTFSLPFFLLACDAWLDAEEQKPLAYGKSVLFYLAAMLAKSSTVMLPAVLLLYCWWKRQSITRQEIARMVPYAAIAVALGFITIYFQNPVYFRLTGHHPHLIELGGPLTRVLRAGTVVFFYLGKFLLPVGLLPIYARSTPDAPLGLQALALPSLALLLLASWMRREGWGRHVLFGLGFFLINILPVAGLVRMKYFEVAWVADHLAYLPIIGLVALAVAGMEKLGGLMAPRLRPGGVIALVLLVLGLGWTARNYASFFADQKSLWTYTLRGNPDGKMPLNKMAYVLLEERHYDESIREYEIALRSNPDDSEAYCNIGICHIRSGQLDQAQACFEKALEIDPDFADARADLGAVFLQEQRLPQAAAEFQKVVHTDPENPNLRYELGVTLLAMGRAAEAAEQFSQILQADPGYPHIREALAEAQQKAAAVKP